MTDSRTRDKFKGYGNKWLTEGLFLEAAQMTDEHCIYSLQPWDRRKNGVFYPSLHKLFVEMEDVSEWRFAETYFDGYQHWLLIKSKPFFKEYYTKMVEELHAKLAGKSISAMLAQVNEGTASQATLAYLANKGYIDKAPVGKPKRKKPTKKEGNVVEADFDRITHGK
jgi:hypothetical protein